MRSNLLQQQQQQHQRPQSPPSKPVPDFKYIVVVPLRASHTYCINNTKTTCSLIYTKCIYIPCVFMFACIACSLRALGGHIPSTHPARTHTGDHMWIWYVQTTVVKGPALRFLYRKLAGFTAMSATHCGQQQPTKHAHARTGPAVL